jgi:hypothetical protein
MTHDTESAMFKNKGGNGSKAKGGPEAVKRAKAVVDCLGQCVELGQSMYELMLFVQRVEDKVRGNI